MLEDKDEKPCETGGLTDATSVKSEIGSTPPPSSYPEAKPKTPGCSLDTSTTPDPPTEPSNRPASLCAALPQYPYGRVVGEDDHAAAVISPPSATTPPLSQQSQAQNVALKEQEWEIRRIVGKR